MRRMKKREAALRSVPVYQEKANTKFRDNLILRIVKLMNVVVITIPFAACWLGYYSVHVYDPFYDKGNWVIIAAFSIFYAVYGRVYDAFLISINRISEIIYSQGLSAFIADVISYIIIWVLSRRFPNAFPLLAVFASQILLSAGWACASHKWYFGKFAPKKSAIIYGAWDSIDELVREYGLDKKFQIMDSGEADQCIKKHLRILNGKKTVFLCDVSSHERNIILKQCIAQGIGVYVIPRIGDVIMSGAKRMHMFHLPILFVERYNPTPEYLFIKRSFDIAVSAAALVIFSPIMLLTAAAVRLTDGGPVFYRQCRLTQNGRKFNILKFRSMRVDAESDGVARLSAGDQDDRITPVGGVIRKVRIDELPQLFNILEGSMTIVGPRPERPEIASQYEENLPEFALRLQAKAGLTGMAQVYGKYNTTPYDKLKMDLMYIANSSILEDLQIMFATVKILFLPESTQGVEKGQTTAAENRQREVK